MSQFGKRVQRSAVSLNGHGQSSGAIALKLLLVLMLIAAIGLFTLSRITSVQARESASSAPVTQVENARPADPALSVAPSSEGPFEKLIRRSQRAGTVAMVPVELTFNQKLTQAGLVLVFLLTVVLLVPKISGPIGQWLTAAPVKDATSPFTSSDGPRNRSALADEQAAFDSFVSSFRVGAPPPAAKPASAPTPKRGSAIISSSRSAAPKSQAAPQALNDARSELAGLRLVLRELNLCLPGGRQALLKKAVVRLVLVKALLDLPELRPASLLSSALFGLLQQLREKPGAVTPSNLRTSASALDLLETLCDDGIRADLADSPLPRFLAVDDDLICRRALSVALAGPFGAPAVAENGKEALRLASEQQFDVVFLDIEMPEMDGFEVCTALRATDSHRSVPIVFVTSHTGFDARAKSITSGGNDFIAKPFLKSELGLKALTLLLNARLENARTGSGAGSVSTPTNTASASSTVSAPSPAAAAGPAKSAPATSPVFDPAHPVQGLREMQAALTYLSTATAPVSHPEVFRQLQPPLLLLASRSKLAGAQALHQLASATVNLLRKLLEKPALLTESTVPTLSNALHLLESLHSEAAASASLPPARILVVDDDAISRRTISNALQLTFAQPVLAESGEAAITAGEKSSFDLIFMDVLMPGLDGFETTARLRQIELNRCTPVVFVTSQADAASRSRATASGGNGFVAKPILPPELALIALCLHLRRCTKSAQPATK